MHEYMKHHPLPPMWDKDYTEKVKTSVRDYVLEVCNECETQKQLMHMTMSYFKGHLNPHLVIEVIKEQTNLP